MVLNDLSLSENKTSDEIKAELESKLGQVLPSGSFKIILRSYSGDVRTRSSNKVNYNAMILLDPAGRKTALERKGEVEAMGFKVSPSGDVSLN